VVGGVDKEGGEAWLRPKRRHRVHHVTPSDPHSNQPHHRPPVSRHRQPPPPSATTYDSALSFLLLSMLVATLVMALLGALLEDNKDLTGSVNPPSRQFEIRFTLPLLPPLTSFHLSPPLPLSLSLHGMVEGLGWLSQTGAVRGAVRGLVRGVVGALSHAAEDYGGTSLPSVGLL
jgi:hypothetical protein